MENEKFSWKKRARSFKFAAAGISTLIKEEHNARIHCVAAVLAIAAAALLGCSLVEWAIIIICIGAVFAAEAVNTAVEALADKISPEKDPLIRKAKDSAAAAVLILAITAVIIACFILLPKLLR